MKKYKNNNFDFEYPSNWDIEEDKNIISVYNPLTGVGTLQLSIYPVPAKSNINLKDELEDFLKNRHNVFYVREYNGYSESNDIIKEDVLWKYWLFMKGDIIAFVTYNCLKADKGKEEKEISDIIHSLSPGSIVNGNVSE